MNGDDRPAVLSLKDVEAGYGPILALHGVNLEVREGSIVALLGANGAGKSTTLRVTSGLLPPSRGRIIYRGKDVTGQTTGHLVRQGLVHVPEGRQIFTDFTVEENLRIGAYALAGNRVRGRLEEVYTYFPILAQRRRQRAGTLSGGEQQMLAIGRALMAEPQVLLLDEPSLGLAPLIVQDIYRIIRTINEERRVTVLLVEQNAAVALDVASYAYVLETGRVVVEGTPDQLRRNEEVRRSYLGY